MAPPLKETDQPSHLVGKWLYGTPSTLEGVERLWLLLIESTIFWYMFAFLTKTQPALLSEGSRVFDPHSYNPHDIVTHITSRAPLRSTRYVSRHMTAGPTGLLHASQGSCRPNRKIELSAEGTSEEPVRTHYPAWMGYILQNIVYMLNQWPEQFFIQSRENAWAWEPRCVSRTGPTYRQVGKFVCSSLHLWTP